MRELIQDFKFRKIALAIADSFIIAISSMITYFFVGTSRREVVVSIVLSVICCFLTLFICGAYK